MNYHWLDPLVQDTERIRLENENLILEIEKLKRVRNHDVKRIIEDIIKGGN
ncbi:hypothetical protein b3_0157 [Synechococcus phage B3]|nr:hypothetical protein b3_0157 [Synechococcus phage B3]QGT54771.1 hypothetical protein b23_0156 [Synechococcus phage B23]